MGRREGRGARRERRVRSCVHWRETRNGWTRGQRRGERGGGLSLGAWDLGKRDNEGRKGGLRDRKLVPLMVMETVVDVLTSRGDTNETVGRGPARARARTHGRPEHWAKATDEGAQTGDGTQAGHQRAARAVRVGDGDVITVMVDPRTARRTAKQSVVTTGKSRGRGGAGAGGGVRGEARGKSHRRAHWQAGRRGAVDRCRRHSGVHAGAIRADLDCCARAAGGGRRACTRKVSPCAGSTGGACATTRVCPVRGQHEQAARTQRHRCDSNSTAKAAAGRPEARAVDADGDRGIRLHLARRHRRDGRTRACQHACNEREGERHGGTQTEEGTQGGRPRASCAVSIGDGDGVTAVADQSTGAHTGAPYGRKAKNRPSGEQ